MNLYPRELSCQTFPSFSATHTSVGKGVTIVMSTELLGWDGFLLIAVNSAWFYLVQRFRYRNRESFA